MKSPVSLSIVIPTRHRNADLAKCLSAIELAISSIAVGSVEIIVTDDGTEATAASMVDDLFPNVVWLAGPRRGPAANRNHGARFAKGEWLIFTDDDCIPDVGWIKAFIEQGMKPNAQVLEGRTYANGPRRHPFDESPINEFGGNLWSCNFAIRRKLFFEFRGFDERFPFPSIEDTEFRMRLCNRGVTPQFVYDAAVLHPWRRIVNWRLHHRRQMKSRLILEEMSPGSTFSPLTIGLIWQYLRIVLIDHSKFLIQSPIEAVQVLPVVWIGMLRDVCWRIWRPKAAEFEV